MPIRLVVLKIRQVVLDSTGSVENGFAERGPRVLTHGHACSLWGIDYTSAGEMGAYFTDTGSKYNRNHSNNSNSE